MNNINIEDRIKFYMGKYYNKQYKIKIKSEFIRNRNEFKMLEPMYINLKYLLESFKKCNSNDARKAYIKPFVDLIKSMDNKYQDNFFLYLWGDIAHDPEINCIICKTRPLNNDSVIIQKLEIDRHWIYLSKIKQSDINYKDKINKCIWRGGTTGYRRRRGSRYTCS